MVDIEEIYGEQITEEVNKIVSDDKEINDFINQINIIKIQNEMDAIVDENDNLHISFSDEVQAELERLETLINLRILAFKGFILKKYGQ